MRRLFSNIDWLTAVRTNKCLPVALKQGCERNIECARYLNALLYGWLELTSHKLGDIRLGDAHLLCELGCAHTFCVQYFFQSHSAKISAFFGKTKELLMESLHNISYSIIFARESIMYNL